MPEDEMVGSITDSMDMSLSKLLGEGNGNPLQHPCLENPMDRRAWYPWGCKELDTTEGLHFHFLE